jgi:predicted nucleic acid-binding protein
MTGASSGSPVPDVVDAVELYAYVDASDTLHPHCTAFLTDYPGTLVVPQLVIAEVAYLIESRLGVHAELLFLADLTEGAFSIEPVHATDWLRILDVVGRYSDLPLGTVDASVIACAERLGVTAVATTDHRHFAAVRPAHTEAFNLLP